MSTPAGRSSEVPAEASIGDHGLIGDMRTAALVDRWGRVSWLCWPRFDCPPLFQRLIDPDGGGCPQLCPSAPHESRRRYLPDTNVVETTFTCDAGGAVAHDFMAASAPPALLRTRRRPHDIPARADRRLQELGLTATAGSVTAP